VPGPTPATGQSYRAVLAELTQTGLILQSDPLLPNVAGIVAGERIAGSWWGHPRGHEIFGVLKQLDANPDTMLTRLVSGKVTYLHRGLWREFLVLATSENEWQRRGLTRSARQLYRLVQKRGELRMDQVAGRRSSSDLGRAAREIEGSLLVYSTEVHTESGSHAKVLMSWAHCPKLRGFHAHYVRPADAMNRFEAVVEGLNRRYGATATLPWQTSARHETRTSP
jgi:hypothetical protein